jgi:hypothetical protein
MPGPKVFKDSIPLWLAVAITVVVSLPFGLWLGKYNLALWCAFIVWAEYFNLGAKPAAIKVILPSFIYAVVLTSLTLFLIPYLSFLPKLVTPGDLGIAAALFIGVAFMVYSMKWAKVFQEGSLPFFNGISMSLAVTFTGSFPKPEMGSLAPFAAGLWAIASAVLGVALAVFNVWILFPREVES